MHRGLGCDLSTMLGSDCSSFLAYYTWPPCWSNSRSQWNAICDYVPQDQGGGGGTDWALIAMLAVGAYLLFRR